MPSKHGALYPRAVGMPQKLRKPLVFGTFFFISLKNVMIRKGAKSPDPNPDPKAERSGEAYKPSNLPAPLSPRKFLPLRSPFLCFLRRNSEGAWLSGSRFGLHNAFQFSLYALSSSGFAFSRSAWLWRCSSTAPHPQ